MLSISVINTWRQVDPASVPGVFSILMFAGDEWSNTHTPWRESPQPLNHGTIIWEAGGGGGTSPYRGLGGKTCD